jgi:hypothetical protein
MASLNWEKANSKYRDTSLDVRMPKKVKPKKRHYNKCFMSGCTEKRYKNSFNYLQSYCLFHCISFNKKL